jgi:hypothetical protein
MHNKINALINYGRAVAEAISRRLPIEEGRFRASYEYLLTD